MNREDLAEIVAPCGLDCGRCLDNPGSPISRHARELRRELGGFAAVAERFAGMDPAFADYAAFEKVLDRFAGAGCSGCRGGQCLLKACRVKHCVKERGVDWCHQCAAFPCEETGLPPMLHERWKNNNERMREVGVAAYLAEQREKPRY